MAHEDRQNLYEKAKARYSGAGLHPDLVERMASDPRLQEGHDRYLHSGIDRMLVEGQHGQQHDNFMESERERKHTEMLDSVVKGQPEKDPRLDPSSEHYAHSGTDRFMIQSWHQD